MKISIPKHLSAASKKWFSEVVETFELDSHHIHILTLAAESLDRANEARKAIDTHGMTYLDKSGFPKARSEVIIERDCKDLFRRLLRELNLSEEQEESRPPGLKFRGK